MYSPARHYRPWPDRFRCLWASRSTEPCRRNCVCQSLSKLLSKDSSIFIQTERGGRKEKGMAYMLHHGSFHSKRLAVEFQNEHVLMGTACVDGSVAAEVIDDGTEDDVLEGVSDDVPEETADTAPAALLLAMFRQGGSLTFPRRHLPMAPMMFSGKTARDLLIFNGFSYPDYMGVWLCVREKTSIVGAKSKREKEKRGKEAKHTRKQENKNTKIRP